MKDTKERPLKNNGRGVEISNNFWEGNDSTFFFHMVVRGATKQGGKIVNDLGV